MKRCILTLCIAFSVVLLSADEISQNIQSRLKPRSMFFITDAKYDKCSIIIDDKTVYQRECEFEYVPNLALYTTFNDFREVWIFQDMPMGNACNGGKLRIFERDKRKDKIIIYRGEVDWCGIPVFKIDIDNIEIYHYKKSELGYVVFKQGEIYLYK